ncbi:MAG: TM2 domain-containing protein [Candidatus Levyibacteriota bacterium]
MTLTQAEKDKIEAKERYRAGVRRKLAPDLEPRSGRDRILAGLLAIVFGSIGIHKFYMNRPGWGVIYILFSWSFIPGIAGFIEGIYYLCMSDQSFRLKYSR